MGTVADGVHNVHDGHVAHHHHHHGAAQDKHHTGANLAEHSGKAHGDDAAEQAAAGHGLALGPQGLDESAVPLVAALGQHQVEQSAHQHREEHGAPHPQAHGASPVEHEHHAGHQQHGGHQPETVPNHALGNATEEVDENGVDIKVPKGGEDGQKETDRRPHLPADGLGLAGRLFSAG